MVDRGPKRWRRRKVASPDIFRFGGKTFELPSFDRIPSIPRLNTMAAIRAHVALIGVGLVGKQVVHQLSSASLSPLFTIISLTNSKYTLSIAPSAGNIPAATLISLLPPSSGPLPKESTHAGTAYSLANTQEVIKTLAASAEQTKIPTILIDCTSDLSVTSFYPLAISSGLSVVTPNKKGFSSSKDLWDQIVKAQAGPRAGLVYMEATVGAGLPIISTLRDLLKTGDEVTKVEGVLSGTLSYIFNEFSKPGGSGKEGKKFSEIVKIAKDNGYTVSFPIYLGSSFLAKLTSTFLS